MRTCSTGYLELHKKGSYAAMSRTLLQNDFAKQYMREVQTIVDTTKISEICVEMNSEEILRNHIMKSSHTATVSKVQYAAIKSISGLAWFLRLKKKHLNFSTKKKTRRHESCNTQSNVYKRSCCHNFRETCFAHEICQFSCTLRSCTSE